MGRNCVVFCCGADNKKFCCAVLFSSNVCGLLSMAKSVYVQCSLYLIASVVSHFNSNPKPNG